jgi:4-oxalocrotonate tautomerase
MPTVIVEMLEGRTVEQKRELVKRITDAIVEIARTKPENVRIYFHDIPPFNLGQSGILRVDQKEKKG